jgi:hypothetical protein
MDCMETIPERLTSITIGFVRKTAKKQDSPESYESAQKESAIGPRDVGRHAWADEKRSRRGSAGLLIAITSL